MTKTQKKTRPSLPHEASTDEDAKEAKVKASTWERKNEQTDVRSRPLPTDHELKPSEIESIDLGQDGLGGENTEMSFGSFLDHVEEVEDASEIPWPEASREMIEVPSEIHELRESEQADLSTKLATTEPAPPTPEPSSPPVPTFKRFRNTEPVRSNNQQNNRIRALLRDDKARRKLLDWMVIQESTRGTHLLHIPRWNSSIPYRAVLLDGKLCFGFELEGNLFIDMDFRKQAPEVFEKIKHAITQRDGMRDHPFLLDQSEIELDESQRAALGVQIARILFKSSRLLDRPLDKLKLESFELPEGMRPVRYSMVELLLGLQEEPAPISEPLRQFFETLQTHSDEAWLLQRIEDTSSFSIIEVQSVAQQNTSAVRKAFKMADNMAENAVMWAGDDSRLATIVLQEERHYWSCAVSRQTIALHRIPSQKLGLAMGHVSRLFDGDTP